MDASTLAIKISDLSIGTWCSSSAGFVGWDCRFLLLSAVPNLNRIVFLNELGLQQKEWAGLSMRSRSLASKHYVTRLAVYCS